MIVAPHETERFYRIWWPLLRYVNAQRQIVADLPVSPEDGSLAIKDAFDIRKALWEDDQLRAAFIAENPAGLSQSDLELVDSWRYRVAGNFFIFRFLKKHTIFIAEGASGDVYGVLGLVSPIEEIIDWPLPVLVQAVLLPFEDRIIYDSLLAPYSLMFGSGIRGSLNETYRHARERGAVITALLPSSQPGNTQDMLKDIRAGNMKVLTAFRKDLVTSNLSLKMVEQHSNTIETFGDAYLLTQDPPRALLDINIRDLQTYLDTVGQQANPTSFKRFIRFLDRTGRIDWDAARDMQDVLKYR